MYIEQLIIENFKSIRSLHLGGLKKINLLIGRPNVGKSNILEALSMFSIPYLKYTSKKLTDLVRIESPNALFFDGYIAKNAKIYTNGNSCLLRYERVEGLTVNFNNALLGVNEKFVFRKGRDLASIQGVAETNIKVYKFLETRFKNINVPFLNPPYGNNLMNILETLPKLTEDFSQLFQSYGLKLMLDETNHSLRIVKEKGNTIFSLPYHSIADTLRRVIFFKTAVASNENSVLLFEEPEAHAFPPYIVDITYEIMSSKTNQFFIATHSPYILSDFLENAREDLAIFMVDYQKGETIIKALTEREIIEVQKKGIDLFFNQKLYL